MELILCSRVSFLKLNGSDFGLNLLRESNPGSKICEDLDELIIRFWYI